MRKKTFIVLMLLAVVLVVSGIVVSKSFADTIKHQQSNTLGNSHNAVDLKEADGCATLSYDQTIDYSEYKGISPLFCVAYNNPCPGSLTCETYFCGGTDKNPYVCCPIGSPYLNHCDCKCYTSSNFNCMSYSYCRQR